MEVVYWLCNAMCVLTGICGLLTQPLKKLQYLILTVYLTGIGTIGDYLGRNSNLLMISGLLLVLLCMIRKNRMVNLALACFGYMTGILCNNVFLVMVTSITGIGPDVIAEKYWLLFSIGYLALFFGIIGILRYILFKKIRLLEIAEKKDSLWTALTGNLLLFLLVFLINIALGRSVGYDSNALKINCIIFAICLVISSGLMIRCAKSVQEEEKQEAKLQEQKNMENYVRGLEYMLDDTTRFHHDYKNLLASMAGYLRENRTEELKAFFNEKLQIPWLKEEERNRAWTALRHVYPMELKGLFYEKVVSALAEGIEVCVEIVKEVHVEYEHIEDLIRILGIFADNAIEAAKESKNEKMWISIQETEQGVLFWIENTCVKIPDLAMMFEKGYSTKGENRGNGLYWAEELIEKHPEMYHEIQIKNENVIEKLEIEWNK